MTANDVLSHEDFPFQNLRIEDDTLCQNHLKVSISALMLPETFVSGWNWMRWRPGWHPNHFIADFFAFKSNNRHRQLNWSDWFLHFLSTGITWISWIFFDGLMMIVILFDVNDGGVWHETSSWIQDGYHLRLNFLSIMMYRWKEVNVSKQQRDSLFFTQKQQTRSFDGWQRMSSTSTHSFVSLHEW